jgi:hypothetical protein
MGLIEMEVDGWVGGRMVKEIRRKGGDMKELERGW